MSTDIFAGLPGDADLLAAIYDLEHDAVSGDLGFYRRLVRRGRGPLLDLGCGSGRLFRAFLDGGASTVRQIITGDSYRSQQANTVHFGLGKAERVESVEIKWVNGQRLTLSEPAANRYHDIRVAAEHAIQR